MWHHPAIRLIAPVLICFVVSARAETGPTTQPADVAEPTAAQLLKEIRLLRKELSGDLDNICLKALRREPERRYQSAEQLSDDITRYFKGMPVLARPDTKIQALVDSYLNYKSVPNNG